MLDRIVTIGEVTPIVEFLASPTSAFVSGQVTRSNSITIKELQVIENAEVASPVTAHGATGMLPNSIRVQGKPRCIVGLGRIGKAVRQRAAAFSMNIAFSGPRAKPGLPVPAGLSITGTTENCLLISGIYEMVRRWARARHRIILCTRRGNAKAYTASNVIKQG